MQIHGVIRSIHDSQVTISNKTGELHEFSVNNPWDQFLPFLKKYDMIFVSCDGDKIGEDDLLVLEPTFQVPVTQTIDAIDCPRKVYVKHMGAQYLDQDQHIRKRQIQGNLLHNLFTQKITQPIKIEDAIEDSIAKSKIDLITSDVTEDEARSYLLQNGMLLKSFSIKGKSEIDVQNWKLGLHGKFDAITKNKIIELKSSNIPETTPWPGHNYQLNTYLSMMEDVGDFDGLVLYLKNGDMGVKFPTKLNLAEIMIARNWTYLVQSGKYIPLILRGQDSKICRSCYVKKGCQTLCSGLETQRDCDNCFHDTICDKQRWNEPTFLYHQNMINALNAEEIEIKSEEYQRFAYMTNKQSMETAINQGDAILTITKIHERIEEGYYYTSYNHNSSMPKFRKGDYGIALNLNQSVSSTSLYDNIIIVKIDENTIELQSLNTLPKDCLIVSSNSASLIRRGRRAIYRTTVHSGNLLTLIRASLTKKPKLDDFEVTTTLKNTIFNYNELQEQAINRALSTPDIMLVQGPAGTGKTSVVVEIINQLLRRRKKILCSAFTNMAVDNIGLKLKDAGIDFLRLGNVHSIREDLREFTIEQREEYFRNVSTGKGPGIILATTTTIANTRYDDLFFDYILIDEAAQMMETDSLQAILHGEKAIFVGDHAQLQPIVTSEEAQNRGLHVSMFERLVSKFPNRYLLLRDQYRMSDAILNFPNEIFYSGELRSATQEIANQYLNLDTDLLKSDQPFQVINLQTDQNNPSQINYHEALYVSKIVNDLIFEGSASKTEIGIITPFRAQVRLLRDIMPGIDIDTVDRFQGSEREIIIFSTITSLDVPIVADGRRINVALTRAKKKLVVLISDIRETGSAPVLSALFRNATKRGLVTTITKFGDLDQEILDNHNRYVDKIEEKLSSITILRKIHGKHTNIYYNSIELVHQSFKLPSSKCAICWADVQSGVECPGCRYQFHYDHLYTWITRISTCPVCKHTLSIK